jgi:hypothetical protein
MIIGDLFENKKGKASIENVNNCEICVIDIMS